MLTEEIQLEDGKIIKGLDKKLQVPGGIQHAIVKKISAKYTKRVQKILKLKLNGGNSITAWTISVIQYSTGITDWTQAELDTLDCRTRKRMTANHTLHPHSDID